MYIFLISFLSVMSFCYNMKFTNGRYTNAYLSNLILICMSFCYNMKYTNGSYVINVYLSNLILICDVFLLQHEVKYTNGRSIQIGIVMYIFLISFLSVMSFCYNMKYTNGSYVINVYLSNLVLICDVFLLQHEVYKW